MFQNMAAARPQLEKSSVISGQRKVLEQSLISDAPSGLLKLLKFSKLSNPNGGTFRSPSIILN